MEENGSYQSKEKGCAAWKILVKKERKAAGGKRKQTHQKMGLLAYFGADSVTLPASAAGQMAVLLVPVTGLAHEVGDEHGAEGQGDENGHDLPAPAGDISDEPVHEEGQADEDGGGGAGDAVNTVEFHLISPLRPGSTTTWRSRGVL